MRIPRSTNVRANPDFAPAALLFFVLAAFFSPETVAAQDVREQSTEPLEEIVVYGKKSLLNLRRELRRAEDDFYGLFNTLNVDDEFDIHCENEAPIGSHINERVCKANYVREATAAETRDRILGQAGRTAAQIVSSKQKKFHSNMVKMVEKNPELFQALVDIDAAGRILKSERDRRCEGRIFICRK